MLDFAIGGAGTFCAVVMGCWGALVAGVLYVERLERRAR